MRKQMLIGKGLNANKIRGFTLDASGQLKHSQALDQ